MTKFSGLTGKREGSTLRMWLLSVCLITFTLPAVAAPAIYVNTSQQSITQSTYNMDDLVEAVAEAVQGTGFTSNNDSAQNTDRTVTSTTRSRTSTANSVAPNQLVLNNPVVDQAHVLSASEKRTLENKLRALYQTGMAQMAVVIVPSTQGQSTFDYALQVAERWGLGKKGTDNGVLMLVAINDRNMYILTGYGVEGVLPDAALKRIIMEDITPYFKRDDYAGGITAGINRIEERLQADPEVLRQADAALADSDTMQDDFDDPKFFILFFIGYMLGQFLTSFLGRFLGAGLTAVSVAIIGSFYLAISTAISTACVVFIVLMIFGGGGRRRGGVVYTSDSGFSSGWSSSDSGFGGGGFSGGGGSFGGGGAGGSW